MHAAVVRIGDQVLSVDNVVVVGQPPALVQHALKGKVGSEVSECVCCCVLASCACMLALPASGVDLDSVCTVS
jgi:hypothetical protein